MARRLNLDTTLLIDLQRERLGNLGAGPAHAFFNDNLGAELFVSTIALGEYAEGFASADHPSVRVARDQLSLLPIDEQTALVYAAIARELRHRGALIGVNDLWIGAASVRYGLPIVTANGAHFRRIDGLEVLEYRTAR